ncbi:TPA: hypothetical protein ACH3X3_012626 [Trebouxia sp. C0006]
MTTITTPPSGDIPLYLGSSFQQSQRDPTYWSLRYDFKPASLNSEAPGTLRMGADNQVSLDLLNKSGGNGDLGFSGHSETYDGLDCVAVFDGESWRLELLTGTLKVRHVKGQARASPAPQALPAATGGGAAESLHMSSEDAHHTQAEEEDWLARDLSQGANGTSPSEQLLPDPATSDRSTDSEDEEELPAEQAADTDMHEASVTHLHPHTNGHPDPGVEAHRSSDDDGAQDTEDEQDGNAAHDEEPDAQPQAPVPNGMPMTDLERQFFANSQSPSSESSDSSSDSDQESLNAASEDDDDDGLDHF